MPQQHQRSYRYHQTIRLPHADDTVEVRYAITWHPGTLAAMVRKAARNKGGRSLDGPITVHIHPADLARLAAPTPEPQEQR